MTTSIESSTSTELTPQETSGSENTAVGTTTQVQSNNVLTVSRATTTADSSSDSDSSDEVDAPDFLDDRAMASGNADVGAAIAAMHGKTASLESGELISNSWKQAESSDRKEDAMLELEINGQPVTDAGSRDNSQWLAERDADSVFAVAEASVNSDANQNLTDMTRQSGSAVMLENGTFHD